MSFLDNLDLNFQKVDKSSAKVQEAVDRFKAEVKFAQSFAKETPDKKDEWEKLIAQAVQHLADCSGTMCPAVAVEEAEKILAPIGEAAKQFTIHCVGHAHIDMNWLWNWPETVATVNDTFMSVDMLMDEFPEFKFSQDQASVYQIAKQYLPEVYERVKQRVKEGRWEVTASQWVEGDKNLASGEILCRHLLYTKQFIAEEFGLPIDAVKVNYEPDTFGHAHTVPMLLSKAGVRWYYFCRAGQGPEIFWWKGPDGSRVLGFDNRMQWYLGPLTPAVSDRLMESVKKTGLKDYLFVYGVGNHGGGPTRRDLRMAGKMATWPIFPTVKLSTYTDFFSAIEPQAQDLPVVDKDMNFVFEGCYTSQSNIKNANRKGENALVEAEAAALLGGALVDMPYPADKLLDGWRGVMFNQFHDILPGSGIPETYQYAQGVFQNVIADTSLIKTRAFRSIASKIDTASTCRCGAGAEGLEEGQGLGGGPGESGGTGGISRRGAGAVCCDSFVVFNPNPWPRDEVITVRLWDREWPEDKIVVINDAGETIQAQFVAKGPHWGHSFIDVAFPAEHIGGLGYRTFTVARKGDAAELAPEEAPCKGEIVGIQPTGGGGLATGVCYDISAVLENEFYRIEVEQTSGAIKSLIDKATGAELVPEGERLGVLEYVLEHPHGMTAWEIGQIAEKRQLLSGARIEVTQKGPYLTALKAHHQLNDSTITVTIELQAGVPQINFTLDINWLEIGTREKGVPALKAVFPLAVKNGTALFEGPNGSDVRPTDGHEAPAQKFVDLTGSHLTGATEKPVGAALLNDCKYGHGVLDNTMRVTLLRSSYDPDPLPELGKHTIKLALRPHVGAWSVADASRAGYELNFPLNIVNATQQKGELAAADEFVTLETKNVMLSGIKKAEKGDGLIVRLYELNGEATTARVKISSSLTGENASAVETDLLERPLETNTAKFADGVLSVDIPAKGIVTVKIG